MDATNAAVTPLAALDASVLLTVASSASSAVKAGSPLTVSVVAAICVSPRIMEVISAETARW